MPANSRTRCSGSRTRGEFRCGHRLGGRISGAGRRLWPMSQLAGVGEHDVTVGFTLPAEGEVAGSAPLTGGKRELNATPSPKRDRWAASICSGSFEGIDESRFGHAFWRCQNRLAPSYWYVHQSSRSKFLLRDYFRTWLVKVFTKCLVLKLRRQLKENSDGREV